MLTRKCEETISKLLGKGDFNVRMTITEKKTSRFVQKSFSDGAWREVLRDSIGGGIILDSRNTYLVSCQTEAIKVDFAIQGDKIIKECWKYIQDSDAARINITKFPTEVNKEHSWIIVRD